MGLGNESILGKKYLVYFVKSPFSKVDDDAWICAGAIVSPTQILTAAACLVNVDKIYAIAGYKKYVHGNDIENDECTRIWKKKVVKVSVPKEYNMATDKQPDWMEIDLGVATVDEPYNFTELSHPTNCSYEPQSIIINYDKKNEVENVRATALGWGGIKIRQPKELAKLQKKPQILKEASTIIIEKKVCLDLIKGNVSKEVLNKYILCASGNGMVVDDGEETSVDTRPFAPDECPYNSTESGCLDANYEMLRRQQSKINVTIEQREIYNNNKTNSRRTPLIETCQNDHGGPLTTWIGTEEMVLGVALDGISNPNFDCVGPRIYVSTAETAKIIKCLLETNETQRKICNNDNKEHQVHDIEIKWPKDMSKNSSKGDHKISPFLRQGNEEQPLHVRPTKDPGNVEEHGNPLRSPQLEIPVDQFYNSPPLQTSTINPYYQLQNQQPVVPEANAQQYGEQSQGQMQQSMDLNQQQSSSLSQSQVSAYNQPQPSANIPPQVASFNQQPMETQPQPSDSFNQQQPSSYDQQSFGSQNQQLIENYKQQQAYIQQHVESFSDPQAGSYNQPQTVPSNQSPTDTFNQQNQGQKETLNQPSQDVFGQPAMDPFKQPQTEPFSSANQPQSDAFNQPIGSPDQIQMGSPDQQNLRSPDQQQIGQPNQQQIGQPNLQQMGQPDQQQMAQLNQQPIGQTNQQQMAQPNQQQIGQPDQQQLVQTNQQQIGQPNQQQIGQPDQQQLVQTSQQQMGQPNQQQIGQPNQQQMDLLSQPQIGTLGQQPVEQLGQSQTSFNQPQNDGNKIQADPFNQLQTNSYNQPQTESRSQPLAEESNQPQGSFNNQQLNPPNKPMDIAMYSPGQGDSFNQQQSDAFQQSQTQSKSQYSESFQVPQAQQSDPFSQQQIDPSKQSPLNQYIQQQADPLKQGPSNQYMQQQVDQFKPQQQKESFNQQPVDPYALQRSDPSQSGQTGAFNIPQNNPFKQQPEQLYNQPQDQFRKPESMQEQQIKTQPFSQQQDSFAQASYSNSQIEAFKPSPPETEADAYNPLAFLNRNYDEPFKVDTFKPQPIEPHKQPNSEPYNNNQQPFKPAPVEPYVEHSLLRDRGQPRSPQSAPSLQTFIQSKIPVSSPTFDKSHIHNILRERPPNEPEPPRGETQTFEQIYSQFRGPGSESSQQGATEQTFEEVYKNLHDGSADLPHELQLESRFDQPFEQQFEQTNQSPKILSMPRAADGNDEIKVRPQVPFELPDYSSYDVRRQNNNDSIAIKLSTTLSSNN
ncbi:putative uncharacterized protein DDB_G0271606 [Spodoptera litura]|uniref:Peptidase S1 domain-containing protein n=1 Tax=Spodoptera litura TaxID=69820 RepID=A0A9J7EA99_SPOLT|nr:putative uncharacterized protein DDB_G0271606 [Spodoptera litura]